MSPDSDDLRRGYARGRARDEEIRAGLEPLTAGERPFAVTVAAAVCVVLGLTNLVLMAAGVDANGEEVDPATGIVFAVLVFGLAYGLVRTSYWVVLAFEALLGVTLVVAALSLMTAANLGAAALCLAIIGLGGWLFWTLIRAMARIQAPSSRL